MTTASQFISVRETAQILETSEKKVMDLIEERKLQAYRIADKFLRLKREEVLGLRETGKVVQENKSFEYTAPEKINDFFYFHDFTIASIGIILILLYFIFFV